MSATTLTQVRALMAEAGTAGDLDTVALCHDALFATDERRTSAQRRVALAIQEAAARSTDGTVPA